MIKLDSLAGTLGSVFIFTGRFFELLQFEGWCVPSARQQQRVSFLLPRGFGRSRFLSR
jgi:hypothetical protein